MTVASPSLLSSQSPPKPVKSVFVGTGPYSDAPLLDQTWKLSLTIWTYWLRPAAPFGSGGIESWTATPSKFLPVIGAAPVGALDWTT